jgi:formylglycine-generating enzyme required for sulfatase activity
MLAKDPGERPQSAAALMRGLGWAAGESAESKVPAPVAPTIVAQTGPRDKGPAGQRFVPARPAMTTLGGATSEIDAPRRAGRGWWIVLGGGAAVLVASAGIMYALIPGDDREAEPAAAASVDASPAPASSSDGSVAVEPVDPNPFVRIEPPARAVVLGVLWGAGDRVVGLRRARGVHAPSEPYEIQQHEVTWAELDPWLADNQDARIYAFPSTPDAKRPGARAKFPATGIPWATAAAYCELKGWRLPTEQEWEYAARGPELRPYAWGRAPPDPERVNAFAGADARVASAMSSDQDRTPGRGDGVLYDMMGNAVEWTSSVWTEDQSDDVEDWAKDFRVIRGLPLSRPPPQPLPAEGAAHREPLCAVAKCLEGEERVLEHVGFRCARSAK